MFSKDFKPVIFAAVLLFALAGLPFAHAANNTNGTGNSTGNVTATPTPTPTPSISPVEEAAAYYLEGGEKKEIKDFTHQGASYHMLIVDGSESVIFDASANPVTDEAKVKELAQTYADSLTNPFKQENLDSLKSSAADLNKSYTYCTQAYTNFTKGIRNCFLVIAGHVWLCNFVYYQDLGPILNFNYSLGGSKKSVESGFAAMNSSMQDIKDGVTALDAGFQTFGLIDTSAQLEKIGRAGSNFRAGYQTFLSGHNNLLTTYEFASDGGLNRCAIATSAISTIESSGAMAASVPNPSAMTAKIIEFTSTRSSVAAKAKRVSGLASKLAAFEAKLVTFKAGFTPVSGLDPTYFNNADTTLKSMLEKVKTGNDTDNSAKAFDEKMAEVDAAMNRSLALLPAYASSDTSINNATIVVGDAVRKFGTTDPRVTSAQMELQSIKKSFELKEADLKAGRPVTKADFEAIQSNSTALSGKLTGLGRIENELDFVTIGGAILLLIVLGGGIWFLRRMRQRQSGL
jgi:hypothetical protein